MDESTAHKAHPDGGKQWGFHRAACGDWVQKWQIGYAPECSRCKATDSERERDECLDTQ